MSVGFEGSQQPIQQREENGETFICSLVVGQVVLFCEAQARWEPSTQMNAPVDLLDRKQVDNKGDEHAGRHSQSEQQIEGDDGRSVDDE